MHGLTISRPLKKTMAVGLSLSFLLATSYLPVRSQPRARTQFLIAKTHPQYEKAKRELSDSLYVVYRIVDRIARANGLDQAPWRVVIEDAYEINANQSQINRIRVFNGLLDQTAGDSSALACVIGHELAHSTKRHQARILDEVKKLEDEHNQRLKKSLRPNVGQAVIGILTGRRTRKNERKLKEKHQAELNEAVAENRRQHELESDEAGYIYMVTAGFEPDGCVRMLELLSRSFGADVNSDSHPSIPRRLEQLNVVMSQQSIPQLVNEGKARLRATYPLTYEPSKDGVSLRINSGRGGSTVNDLDRILEE